MGANRIVKSAKQVTIQSLVPAMIVLTYELKFTGYKSEILYSPICYFWKISSKRRRNNMDNDQDNTPVLESRNPVDPSSNNRGNFTRNLAQEADDEIAKKMFFGGLCLLPWLHLVNIIHFRKQFMDATVDPKVTLCTYI